MMTILWRKKWVGLRKVKGRKHWLSMVARKEQGYRGDANWPIIAEVANELTIPVIGNGNIACAADVIRIREQTNCAGLMIGRAALGYPWIFRDIKHYLKYGEVP
jgi:tRNA-dihydrouridine synthase